MRKTKPNPRIRAYVLRSTGIQQVEHHDYRSVDRLNQQPVPTIRTGNKRRQEIWVKASGGLSARIDQAMFYLNAIDHEASGHFWTPEQVLGHAVSNLRNYHCLDRAETVSLMRSCFNDRSPERWSDEAIAYTWEQVAGYVPSLGLSDPSALSMQHTEELEDLVVDLLAFTRSGGRVAIRELFKLFQEWNPDFEVNQIAFGRAFTAHSGIRSIPSKDGRYYSGLHIPSELELKDPMHSPGALVDPWSAVGVSDFVRCAA